MSTQMSAFFPDETPIEQLDLRVRTYNCLKRTGIHQVGQILAMDKAALLGIRNLSAEHITEIRDRLIACGFMSAERPVGPFAEEDKPE